MPQAKLKIPTLFRQIQFEDQPTIYQVRPLFFAYPTVSHMRYDRAKSLFIGEVRKYFSQYVFDRDNMTGLLWYTFHPEVQYHNFLFQFTLNGTYVNGNFGVASFEMQGHTFVTLPAFEDYMFIAKNEDVPIKQQVEQVIKKLFRTYQNVEGSDFSWQKYTAPIKEFVRTIETVVSIRQGQFSFEKSESNGMVSLMGAPDDFHGEEEVNKVGYSLNDKYPEELGYAFYQEEASQKIAASLYGKENIPIAIIGDIGIGKHAILQQSVRNYLESNQQKEASILDQVWHLDPSRIISGMSYVGQWERRFESIIEFLQNPVEETNRTDKLLIDNSVALLRIGQSAQSKMNLASVLKPYLEQRSLQMVILATPDEWKIVQEKDRSFADLFQVTRLNEPDKETVAKIVLKQRRYLERRENASLSMQAVRQLFTIQRNFLKNQALPGSLLKLMEQLVTKYTLRSIDAPEVRREFEDYSGYREQIFDRDSDLEKRELDNYFSARLVGQPKAVTTLTDLVHTVKAKLTNPAKPLGSYLFIGPTGVGKTQAAKVLSRYLMGSEDRLLRFDMNEYIDGLAVSRLIGDYHNPEGQLTGKVRYQPFSILLLDEIEKANPAVHDLLLQVLDDGRLTDSIGRTIDFSNTIIIMTSNLGATEVSSRLGFGSNSADEGAIYRKAVENKFRPEFINRIGEIVIFNPLELEHILLIARLQISELLERDGFVRRTTILNIAPEALDRVARSGFDKKMGGRALKRQIEKDLTELSAAQLVSTYSEQPILFNIILENNKLVPKIRPLEFVKDLSVPILPELPEISKGRGFYNRLKRELEKIENRVSRILPPNSEEVIRVGESGGGDLNWQYYDFKNRLAELKEEIINLGLGFRDTRFALQPAIPIRLKISGTNEGNWHAERQQIKDRIFQQEALNEISDNYNLANPEFDSIETEFVNSFLNVEFLKIAAKGFFKEKTDKIKLEFDSLINGKGGEQIQFLLKSYVAFFEEMNIAYEWEKGSSMIHAEGFSLLKMMQGEEGLHLFYQEHRNPVPIRCSISLEQKNRSKRNTMQVLRIYARGTMTDLRSGYSNINALTARELKLLIYAGTI